MACRPGESHGRAIDPTTAAPSGSAPAATAPSDAGSPRAPPGASDAGASPPDPGPPAVQLVGRFDLRDPAGPVCGWPGCRIVARFEGTGVTAQLRETEYDWMQGTPSEWDVLVDGVLQPKLVTTANATTKHVLAKDLPRGPHSIELYRRSEAQTGFTQFLGFDFGGGALLPPPLRRTRRIEIVGDSAATGFGVEGASVGPDCPGVQWAAEWENFHRSFGALMGEALDAEVIGTSYSGKGLVKNIDPSDTDTMPLIFDRANPVDSASTWSFTSEVPDLVVVMLGGNDFDDAEGPATPEEFTAAYDAFVATLRTNYPNALLLLVTSGSVSDDAAAGRSTRTNILAATAAVSSKRRASGDRRVLAVAPRVAQPSELTGCNGHGTPAYHQHVADELVATVRPALGW